MVVGNGMVAKQFKDYITNENFLIFASGVSDSKSNDEAEYEREINLLKLSIENNQNCTLVYFSTTSINDPAEKTSRYVAHKLFIENYIQTNAVNYVLFRVSNLVGLSFNFNTVLNFFIHQIKEGTPFNLWLNACRNLIDVDDFYTIANDILVNKLYLNQTINIANAHNYDVKDIVERLEIFYKRKADYIPINKGGCFDIDISKILPVIDQSGIKFDDKYLDNLLKKYYSE